MWELYAFWVYGPLILASSYNSQYLDNQLVFFSVICFFIFATGSLGSVYGGKISHKIGRTKFNIYMLSCSGISSLLFGLFLNNPFMLLGIALFWGLTHHDYLIKSTIVNSII